MDNNSMIWFAGEKDTNTTSNQQSNTQLNLTSGTQKTQTGGKPAGGATWSSLMDELGVQGSDSA